MRMKDLSILCFACGAFLLSLYMFSFSTFSGKALYGGQLLVMVLCSLSVIALFVLLGWLLIKCLREIRKNTLLRLQEHDE